MAFRCETFASRFYLMTFALILKVVNSVVVIVIAVIVVDVVVVVIS